MSKTGGFSSLGSEVPKFNLDNVKNRGDLIKLLERAPAKAM